MMSFLCHMGFFLPATSDFLTCRIWSCHLMPVPKVFWPATGSPLTCHMWSSYLQHDVFFCVTLGLLTCHKRSSHTTCCLFASHIWFCHLMPVPNIFWPATYSPLTWHMWSSYLQHDVFFCATWSLLTCHKWSSYLPHMVLSHCSGTSGIFTCHMMSSFVPHEVF